MCWREVGGNISMTVIKCPIHQYIQLSEIEEEIVDTKIFQRLRGIKQNGLADYTYPTALASRFDHSLGVMHLGSKIVERVFKERSPVVDKFFRKVRDTFYSNIDPPPGDEDIYRDVLEGTRLACLLHDIGHFPFSHSMERIVNETLGESKIYEEDFIKDYRRANTFSLHEFVSYKVVSESNELLQIINKRDPYIPYKIALNILSPFSEDILSKTSKGVLRGEIDADRMDYLLRDGFISGVSFGRYDIDRLLISLELCEKSESDFEILPNIRGLSAIESFFIERLKLYKWLYHHHNVVFYEASLESLIRLLFVDRAPLRGINEQYRILDLSRLHWKNYCPESKHPTDDHFIRCKLYELYSAVEKWLNPNEETKKHIEEWRNSLKPPLDDIGFRKRLLWSKLLLEGLLFRKKNRITLWKNKAEYDETNRLVDETARESLLRSGADQAAVNSGPSPFYKKPDGKIPSINYLKEKFLKPSKALTEFVRFLWDCCKAFKDSNYAIVIDRRKVIPLALLAEGISKQDIVAGGALKKLTDVSVLMKVLSEYPGKEIELFAYLLKIDIDKPPSKEDGITKFVEALVEWMCKECEEFQTEYGLKTEDKLERNITKDRNIPQH